MPAHRMLSVGALVTVLGLILVAVACSPAATPTAAPPTATLLPALTPTTTPLPDPTPTTTLSPVPSLAPLPAVKRVTSPNVRESDLQTLVGSNSAFAFDLYQALREEEGNLFYSPFSIALAFGMLYAGAREEIAQQMADTLHFRLPQPVLHPAFNTLDLELASRASDPAADGSRADEGYQLNIANGLWVQIGYPFLQEYLDVVGHNYDAGVHGVNFKEDPQRVRRIINDWVSEHTENNIRDLFSDDAIHQDVALVLANAIYFEADWASQFPTWETQNRPFYLRDGSQIETPTMNGPILVGYAERDGYQVIELLYRGGSASMVILLPDEGQFEQFESRLDAGLAANAIEMLEKGVVSLYMPRFEFESSFDMAETLSIMGMPNAFNSLAADFSGISDCSTPPCLFAESAVHKAFVAVNEDGTKAGAGTGVIVIPTSLPPDLRINRPFIFLIRDIPTDAILFTGRVLDPRTQERR